MRRAALALTLAVVSVARPSAADSLIPGPLPPGSSVEGGATSRYWSRFDSQPFLAATLEPSCVASSFYSGFYVERNADGRLCVSRDQLQSRARRKPAWSRRGWTCN